MQANHYLCRSFSDGPQFLRKTLEARKRTNKQLFEFSHIRPSLGIEPGP
jgi:hypothetical protein